MYAPRRASEGLRFAISCGQGSSSERRLAERAWHAHLVSVSVSVSLSRDQRSRPVTIRSRARTEGGGKRAVSCASSWSMSASARRSRCAPPSSGTSTGLPHFRSRALLSARHAGSHAAKHHSYLGLVSPYDDSHLKLPYQVANRELCNWRKHREDQHGLARSWLVDPFSSAVLFAGWKELEGQPPWRIRPDYEPLVVTAAQSWLLTAGWRRHGAISVHHVPGRRIEEARSRA